LGREVYSQANYGRKRRRTVNRKSEMRRGLEPIGGGYGRIGFFRGCNFPLLGERGVGYRGLGL